MKVLMTGSTGFVGRNLLLSWIRSRPFESLQLWVRDADKLLSQLLEEDVVLPEWIKVDTVNFENPPKAEFDLVIHLVGRLVGNSYGSFYQDNVLLPLRLMISVRAAGYLILSSQAACGPGPRFDRPRVESDPLRPVTWYGQSKMEMEQNVLKSFPEKNILFLRPPMVLGARDTVTFPLYMMAGSPVVPKLGIGKKYYSFIEVEDLCEAITAASLRYQDWPRLSHPIYFVAHPEPFTDLELLKTGGEVRKRKNWILPIPTPLLQLASPLFDLFPWLVKKAPNLSKDRRAELYPSWWVVSPAKFEEHFQWNAKRNLETALQNTFRWYARRASSREALAQLSGVIGLGR